MAEQTYALSQSGVYGLANGAYADALSAIPDSGVARWEFEQDVTDSWGDNDATNNGATYTSDAQVGDHALSFDGTDDNVQTSAPVLGRDNGFSYAIWAKPDALETVPFFADENSGIADVRNNFGLDSDGTLRFDQFPPSGGSLNSTNSISTGEWSLVGVTVSSSRDVTFYIDDSEAGTGTGEDYSGDSPDWTTIGARVEEGRYFDGTLDDPRVYDKELTSSEWSNLYQTGSIDG